MASALAAAPSEAPPPGELHTQCADDPHPCFACKCRIWRRHGMNLVVPQEWTDRPTVREQEKQAIADAKQSGREFDLAGDRYRHF